ncbi:TPA: hypothetical protein ACH3X1_000429 [Trebouxia sp. C0004]
MCCQMPTHFAVMGGAFSSCTASTWHHLYSFRPCWLFLQTTRCLSAFSGSSLQWARQHDTKSHPVCIAWYEDLLYLSRCDWTTAAAATRTAEYHNHDVDDGVEAFARKTDDVRAATHVGRAK